MLSKEIFVKMYSKAIGKVQAEEMYDQVVKSLPVKKDARKVYLNAFGAEVHVNGDVSAALKKGETLAERIARFDRLSAQVAAIRYARAMGMLPEDEGDEEDVNDFSKLDDVEIKDDFGDVIEKPSVAEPSSDGNVIAKGDDSADGVVGVSGDEPDAGAEPGSAAMLSNDE